MQDLRLAFRALRATPVVSVVAALSLALGIGANTAIFSIVNSLLLRALPVAEPHRLVVVNDSSVTAGFQSWTYAIWDNIRQRAQPFDGAFAWSSLRFNLAESGVHPLSLEELLEAPERDALARVRLGYTQTNGTPASTSRRAISTAWPCRCIP